MTTLAGVEIDEILHRFLVGEAAHDLIRRAYDFAEKAHACQKRKSGEPYIVHPLNVAHLLAEMHFEPAVIAAGLLHDVLEDCRQIPREELEAQFGAEVLVLVEGVTKLDEVEERVKEASWRERDIQELESLRKLFIAMAEDDIRVIFIKLADRLHNMRTLSALSEANQQRMARETLEIFAPVANRLGIWVWKAELEDLSFRYLNPTMYAELAQLLATQRGVREARVEKHAQQLTAALQQEGIDTEIVGRPKHFYSIYHKMRRKNIPFARVYDAEGLRVVVDTKAECYQVLGIVHQLWTPLPGEFDDYIAHPKPNGYQSLHTAVIGEDGASLEIQIRTREMNHWAEYGVAAHWRYKEKDVALNSQVMERIAAMRKSVRELTQDTGDARTFIDSIRTDVFQDRVFVFTPKGMVIDLPVGATPLDFAYHVHTEIGHRCRGARVNGRWTPLNTALQTGDQVEIVPGRKGGPSRDWLTEELGYVTTNRAQHKIRQWFRRQSREENAGHGQFLVEKLLKRMGLKFTLEEVAALYQKRFQQPEDFFAAVGLGEINSEHIVNRLESLISQQEPETPPGQSLEQEAELLPLSRTTYTGEGAQFSVQGTGGLLTHIAQCCKPLPGEEIIGYVTRGRGVTIHRRDCPNILQMAGEDLERLIEVGWGKGIEHTFPVQVVVNAYDRSGLLFEMAGLISHHNINMPAVSTGKRNRHNIIPVYLTLEVPDLATMTRILSKLEQIPNVIEAHRIG